MIAAAANSWTTVLISIMTLCGAAVLLASKIYELRKTRMQLAGELLSDGFIDRDAFHDVYEALGDSRVRLKAKRALIIRIENEGKVKERNGRKYISVIYELREYPLTSIRKRFRKYKIDESYADMLEQLIESDRVFLTPETITGFLRSVYLAQGIGASVVIKLLDSDKRLVYASFNFREDAVPDPEDPTFQTELDTAQHLLGSMIQADPSLAD